MPNIKYLFLPILMAALLVPNHFLKAAEGNSNQNKRLVEFFESEKKLNGAAIEVFWSLQKKFGERFRTMGVLIHCREDSKADEISPKIFELMIEAGKAVDTINLGADPDNLILRLSWDLCARAA